MRIVLFILFVSCGMAAEGVLEGPAINSVGSNFSYIIDEISESDMFLRKQTGNSLVIADPGTVNHWEISKRKSHKSSYIKFKWK